MQNESENENICRAGVLWDVANEPDANLKKHAESEEQFPQSPTCRAGRVWHICGGQP